ncbi:MAG: F0F1 ATP synthase subunit alpha, partial [Candidatus Competibacter sp.]
DRGYLDDVPLNKIGDFEAGLLAFARANHAALIDQINATGDYNDEIESGIKKVVEDFRAHFV